MIEVILALAIFMIGALAIVRIFPPALAAIQGSGSKTEGARAATSTLEKLSGRIGNSTVASVPDAVYFGASDGTYNTTFGGAFNGTINRNNSLPRDAKLAGNGNPANDSALQIGTSVSGSYIDGERQRVYQTDANKLFVLTNFPYVTTPFSLQFSVEDAVEGVRIVDVNAGTANPAKYVFDFSHATLASNGVSWANTGNSMYPAGTTDRTYYISYKWIEANARKTVHGVLDEPYAFPDPSALAENALKTALSDQIVTTTSPGSPAAIVVGEVSVRMVTKISPTVTIPTDDLDGRRAICEFTAAGVSAGDTVRLSYQVADWRSIVIDQVLIRSTGTATLATRGLDEDTYGDEVHAVVYNAPDATGKTSNPIYRSACVPNGSTGACDVSDAALKSVEVSGSKTNRVTVLPAVNTALPAGRLHFAYKPQDGWGVQAAVAARSYVPFLSATPTYVYNSSDTTPFGYKSEPWRQYSWKTGSSNIYFQPNEAGKTVLVTFEYEESGIYHVAKDRIVTISPDLQAVSSNVITGFGGAGGQVSVAELTDLNGIDSPNVTSILSVRGLSVQARAVWADNQGRYSQAVVTDYRKSS